MHQNKASAMEIREIPEEKFGSWVRQADWLQSTISGVDEKMKAILNLLEDYDSPSQDIEIYGGRKEKITEIVQDLCTSYRSLAEEYDHLKTVSVNSKILESSSPSNDGSIKDVDSNPESTVEDGDTECEDATVDVKRFYDNSTPKDGSKIKSESAWSDGMTFRFSKLVEENTQIQVELIRRNSEKKETIRKLQNQVNKMQAENDSLNRTLSYFDRNKQNVQETSPRRKPILIEKFFKCSP